MMICTNYRNRVTILDKMTKFLAYMECACVCVCDAVPTSVSPMWGFLMRFCRQLLRVLVSSRLVDFRNISSISVELDSQSSWFTIADILQLHNKETYRYVKWEMQKRPIVHLDWKMNIAVKPTCGVVTLRTWGWRKWTLWPVCRSEEQTGTLAAFSESPAAYTHTEKYSIRYLTYFTVNNSFS